MDQEKVREIVRRVIRESLRVEETPAPEPLANPEPSAPVTSYPPSPARSTRTLALGADHAGFALKENLRSYIRDLGFTLIDCGTHNPTPVDYPDIALEVARMVAGEKAWRGIIIDGAGIGSAIAANKVPGVRAALCYDISTAKNSREHNDANVLTMGGRLIGEELAKQIVKTFLETEFGGGRHARRVEKIMDIEKQYLSDPLFVEQ